VVLVFAALAGLFDETGGPIIYVREALRHHGRLSDRLDAMSRDNGGLAANANVLADYVLRMLPGANAAPAHEQWCSSRSASRVAVNSLEIRNSDRWIKLITGGETDAAGAAGPLRCLRWQVGPALLPAAMVACRADCSRSMPSPASKARCALAARRAIRSAICRVPCRRVPAHGDACSRR